MFWLWFVISCSCFSMRISSSSLFSLLLTINKFKSAQSCSYFELLDPLSLSMSASYITPAILEYCWLSIWRDKSYVSVSNRTAGPSNLLNYLLLIAFSVIVNSSSACVNSVILMVAFRLDLADLKFVSAFSKFF